LSGVYLAVVCPMANEGADAARFVQEVLQQCAELGKVTFFAVLDKATTDNSLEFLRNYAAGDSRLTVVWAPENRNLVDAYVRGYREAVASGADWILEIDAGFSHHPEDIPKFLKRLQEDKVDCIFGSRFMPGADYAYGSLKRYFVSRGGSLLANTLLGTRLSDMTSGFEMFSRPVLAEVLRLGIQSRAHFFQTEIKVYCRGLRAVEVPIRYSSPSPRVGSSALKDSLHQLGRLARLRWSGKLPLVAQPVAAIAPGVQK
jgi:dolichol-phosphate mannosyltransferase